MFFVTSGDSQSNRRTGKRVDVNVESDGEGLLSYYLERRQPRGLRSLPLKLGSISNQYFWYFGYEPFEEMLVYRLNGMAGATCGLHPQCYPLRKDREYASMILGEGHCSIPEGCEIEEQRIIDFLKSEEGKEFLHPSWQPEVSTSTLAYMIRDRLDGKFNLSESTMCTLFDDGQLECEENLWNNDSVLAFYQKYSEEEREIICGIDPDSEICHFDEFIEEHNTEATTSTPEDIDRYTASELLERLNLEQLRMTVKDTWRSRYIRRGEWKKKIEQLREQVKELFGTDNIDNIESFLSSKNGDIYFNGGGILFLEEGLMCEKIEVTRNPLRSCKTDESAFLRVERTCDIHYPFTVLCSRDRIYSRIFSVLDSWLGHEYFSDSNVLFIEGDSMDLICERTSGIGLTRRRCTEETSFIFRTVKTTVCEPLSYPNRVYCSSVPKVIPSTDMMSACGYDPISNEILCKKMYYEF